MAEMLNLKKGDLLNLTKKEPSLKEVTVAAGWDVVQQHKSFIRRILDPVQDYDLDLVHYLLDCNDNITSIIYYANKRENGIKLNGDNLTGEGDGDDEIVNINFNYIPSNCCKIVTAVIIYQGLERGQCFGKVKNAYVRLTNEENNKELCRFNLTEDGGDNTAVIMSTLTKDHNEWTFKAIGDYSKNNIKSLGNNLKNILK